MGLRRMKEWRISFLALTSRLDARFTADKK